MAVSGKKLEPKGQIRPTVRRPVSIADFSGSWPGEGTRDKTRHPGARAASPPNRREHEARTARRHAPTSTGHPRSTMDPTAALNILQNHARQKQAELAQTPPQRRRTSNVAHARSWRASTRRSRTWRASSESGGTLGMLLYTAAAFNSIFKGSNCVHR